MGGGLCGGGELRGWGGGVGGLRLHCHHQNCFIKTGSDEGNFNVSFNVRSKVT